MGAQLRIGEVARLLGISTKTIRHYHKVGLLVEPNRTDSGYRLYAVADILRLVRIRRLQKLGLSLAQIQHVLGEPESQGMLRQALMALAEGLDEEITYLQMRRERIAALLDRDILDVDQLETTPALLNQVYGQLANHTGGIDASIWEQDRRIFGMLESLALPDGYYQQMTTMAKQTLSDPVLYNKMLMIAERLAALVDIPEDSPMVEHLVAQARTEGWQDQLQALTPEHPSTTPDSGMLGEVMLSVLAPAQRRFFQLLLQGEATT